MAPQIVQRLKYSLISTISSNSNNSSSGKREKQLLFKSELVMEIRRHLGAALLGVSLNAPQYWDDALFGVSLNAPHLYMYVYSCVYMYVCRYVYMGKDHQHLKSP